MVTTGATPETKTEDPGSGSKSKKLCKILPHPANNDTFCKEEEMQKQLCNLEAEKLDTLKQTQVELLGNNEAKLEERDQAQEDVDTQQTMCRQTAADSEELSVMETKMKFVSVFVRGLQLLEGRDEAK